MSIGTMCTHTNHNQLELLRHKGRHAFAYCSIKKANIVALHNNAVRKAVNFLNVGGWNVFFVICGDQSTDSI